MTRPVAGSFRDPSGHLFERDGILYRQVNRVYRQDYQALGESGLYQTLVGKGLLVPHQETDLEPVSSEGWRVIRPERIGFISYPYEWCFSQLREAALGTLDIQRIALDHGLSLRDASAYNIQFQGTRPVLIDTLSFETWRRDQPWVAYRQFCQHFLAPLALMAYRDLRLGRLTRQAIDGIPLDLAAGLLPFRTRLRLPLLLHLHLHAGMQRRTREGPAFGSGGFGERPMRGLIDGLTRAVERLPEPAVDSTWVDYYRGDSYSEKGFEHKRELVAGYLEEVRPATVWDLGANTGVFSRLAAEAGASVVAFDADPATVEAAYRRQRSEPVSAVLPLVVDLSDPSPAIGWANQERMTLAERGPADLVMALALVHHLAISNNLPLDRLASYLAELAPVSVVEFVPKSDPKVGSLLTSREDVFSDYHQEGFEASFGAVFRIERRDPIEDSARLLYLMRRD